MTYLSFVRSHDLSSWVPNGANSEIAIYEFEDDDSQCLGSISIRWYPGSDMPRVEVGQDSWAVLKRVADNLHAIDIFNDGLPLKPEEAVTQLLDIGVVDHTPLMIIRPPSSGLFDIVRWFGLRVNDGRSKHKVMRHLKTEVRELQDEVDGAMGVDGILGEAVDVMACCFDLIHLDNPATTMADIERVMVAKCQKWLRKYGRDQASA